MFDYQVDKQPHFADACRQFAQRHNLEAVAAAVGMRPQMLRNKLNPDQPHRLTCDELWHLTDVTEDPTLIDGLLAQMKCMPAVPMNEAKPERLTTYVLEAAAAVGAVAAGSVSTERLTQTSRHDFIGSVNSGIRFLSLVGLSIQARIQQNPTISATVDVVSGIGAGLS
ncbi:phage regulatory CII family protein [Dickeya ananatis]|uniref:phage regulatory CII family protein n=1 Tax=Dickeya ananatis TaxID=3061286 RepID=UPI0038902332